MRVPGYIFAILLLLLPLAAAAQDIRIHAIDTTGATVRLQGIWPSACEPQIAQRYRDANGATVIVLDDIAPCPPAPHAFTLESAPPSIFSPPPPAQAINVIRVLTEDAAGTPQLVGFAVTGSGTTDTAPHSGFWWPTSEADGSGNVLSIEVQDGTLGVAWLSHDDLSGAPVWLFGTGTLDGRRARIELSRIDNGASPFLPSLGQPRPQHAATLDLVFDSATHAHAWLSRRNPVQPGVLEVATVAFERRPFSHAGRTTRWQGRWLVARDVPADALLADLLPATLTFDAGKWTNTPLRMRVTGQEGFVLLCRYARQGATSADSCTLQDASGRPVARFDDIGLQRMDGIDRNGDEIVLLRAN